MNRLPCSLPWRRGPASLSRRLLLLLLAVGLTPLVVSQLVTLAAFLDQEHHHMVGVAEELAAEKVQEAQALLISKSIQLDQLAQSSLGRADLLQRDWRQQAGQLAFSDLLLVHRPTRRITAAAVHADLVGLHLDSNLLRRSGLHQAVRNLSPWNQVSVASLGSDPSLGGVAAWLAVPLRKEQDSPFVLVGRLDGTALQKMAFKRQRGLAHGASVQLMTLRRQGSQLQFRPLGSSDDPAVAPALVSRPAGWLGAGSPTLRGDGGNATLITAAGQELLAAWREIPFSPVAVLITLPSEEVNRGSQALSARILVILLVTAVLVALVGVLLGRRLVRPLRELHRAVQDFDPDDATSLHPVAVRGRDEIASLADTINAMASRIQERTAHLRATKEELDTTIQTVQTTLLALDLEGRITLLNRSGRCLLGLPAWDDDHSWVGADWVGQWVADADRPLVRRWLEAAVSGQLPASAQVDYAVRTRDRGERLCHWHLSLLEGADGQVKGLLSSGEDITDRQAQAEALEQARRDAERANAAKSDFLSRMSHELRTPMNAIIGMTHLALRTDLDRRQRDYLEKISGAGQNLLQIINDILDFSKIEAGKLKLEQIDFQLDGVLGDVANLVADRVFANGVELLFSIEEEVPSRLNGDPLRLTQVLLNLLSNAAKFTERGEILLRVSVLERQPRRVVLQFAVQDTGIGMSEQQLARLFQTFHQAEASTTRRYGGTGLGLSICQRLLTLMGGSIRVESRLGEGSCFTAVAPFAVVESSSSRVVPEALNGLRALIVDDNALAGEVLQELLTPLPMRCDLVDSGAEALARVRSAARDDDPYGLLLLDWRLGPEPDGLTVAAELRSDPGLPQPRIVMVTAFGFEEALQQAPAGLLDACLSKPVQPSELVDTLATLFAEPTAGSGPDAESAGPSGRGPDADRWGLQGLRVLVVEDNPINQQIVEELLQIVGVVVSTAANGVEALAWLEEHSAPASALPEVGREHPCDLVLLDLNMPVMDGWECARRIHADPRWRDLPLLAMTAHALQQERDRCFALGMQDHITKPIDPQHLYGRLQHWGGRKAPAGGDAVPAPVPLGSSPMALPLPIAELAERLPGFDVTRALRRAGDNVDLYRRLLGSLVHTQADVDLRLAQALAQPDLRQAEHLVHTVKGVAANLGALDLAEAASALEAELRQGRSPAALQAGFVDALHHALAQITTLLAAPSDARGPGPVGDPPVPLPPTSEPLSVCQQALIDRLDGLLGLADGEALDLVEQEQGLLAVLLGTAALDSLRLALERFDFGAARLLLASYVSQEPGVAPCCPS